MPPFQNKSYGVFKYEKLNCSHRILNIKKKIVLHLKFCFLNLLKNYKKKVGAGGKSGARADENHECYFFGINRTMLQFSMKHILYIIYGLSVYLVTFWPWVTGLPGGWVSYFEQCSN